MVHYSHLKIGHQKPKVLAGLQHLMAAVLTSRSQHMIHNMHVLMMMQQEVRQTDAVTT